MFRLNNQIEFRLLEFLKNRFNYSIFTKIYMLFWEKNSNELKKSKYLRQTVMAYSSQLLNTVWKP